MFRVYRDYRVQVACGYNYTRTCTYAHIHVTQHVAAQYVYMGVCIHICKCKESISIYEYMAICPPPIFSDLSVLLGLFTCVHGKLSQLV